MQGIAWSCVKEEEKNRSLISATGAIMFGISAWEVARHDTPIYEDWLRIRDIPGAKGRRSSTPPCRRTERYRWLVLQLMILIADYLNKQTTSLIRNS